MPPSRCRLVFTLALMALGFVSCRTTRPTGEGTPLAPLTATSPQEAATQLAARRAQFTGERSLLRVLATSGNNVQTFRAQLQIDAGGTMLLTVYAPIIGTPAIRLYGSASEVTFVNDVEGTWWKGSAADFARSFGFFGSVAPSSMAFLIAGLPSDVGGINYEYATAGLARANAGDVSVTFDPASYPPHRVTVSRGNLSLAIEHLESVMTADPIVPPEIPSSYRCCVAPRL